MRQAIEEGISEVLSSVVEDVGHAVSRNMSGSQVLQEVLNAPWLHALLKIYECLIQFQRSTPSPLLPYASGLSHEIIAALQKTRRLSPEAVELFSLLSSPHIQALLSSHDSVAQCDFGPVLPPLPDDLPEDEEAMRIVCLVKNNQPLSGEGRSGGEDVGVIRGHWSSLRRLTLERLIPARRAWSREELSASESEARLLPIHPGGRGGGGLTGHFLPRYQSTGSCCLCPQSAEFWKKGLNQSAPSVFTPARSTEKHDSNEDEGTSTGASSDDYAYPPPPVPAYTVSLPSSPDLYKKGVPGGPSRNIPTPGRTSSCPGMKPHRPHSASSSPAAIRSTHQQVASMTPSPERQHGGHAGLYHKRHEELLGHCLMHHPTTAPDHIGCRSPKQRLKLPAPEIRRQCSMDELTSTVQTVASSVEHSDCDVRHLGQTMAAATEMITDSMEDNAQALNLLAEVVDKLQGLIVAKKQEPSPPSRPKRTPPPPPPRISSISPKAVRKPPSPYPRPISPSSSSSCSTSSSSSCADSFTMLQSSPKPANGGNTRIAPSCGAPQTAVVSGSNGQGATIKRNEETGDIYIARVIHGGLADRSGLLHPGDLLVEVNGNPVVGLEPEQVIQILINSQGTILFKVIPNPAQSSSSQKPVYMRAMVDYSPLQDSSIPCPDAGMSFSRGDLLEVVDQSDGHWWQAKKLPCSAAACAGLIPSASMLKSKQREQWWCQPLQAHVCIRPLTLPDNEDSQTHSDEKRAAIDLEEVPLVEPDSDFTDGIYMAGFRRSFRLWRRTSFRRRRQSCTSCSALSSPYEEVVLYQRPPQENHRLVILLGATGVGVNELRKRLIKLNPSTFQSPVPHTSRPIRAGELSGREYHFITKELFEYMVCNHRFVEYGESKGQLYGTSIDAIDEVLKRGRMCIVDVEPHSIQMLRTKKLKPYVIFIKAPSAERLRQTRRDARIITKYSVNRTFSEEDFVELEETSRVIEAKYRQFFDSVLVNDDLQDACMQLCSLIQQAQHEPQWIPVSWRWTDE